MRRRKFIQYAGLGGVGFLLVPHNRLLASALPESELRKDIRLDSFDFNVTTVDQFGQIKQTKKHTAKYFPASLNAAEQLEMVAIAPGRFAMGASPTESQAKRHEFPRHRVKLPAFFMSKTPITQSQWAVIAALPAVKQELDPAPSHFTGSDRPVESVSWLDAVEFCDRLSQYTGRQYQLPSEAQWEYACRSGTGTAFNTGATITSELAEYVGTYAYQAEATGNHRQSTMPVGRFSANAFGLYDMHGNVWEWCADSWHKSYRGAPKDDQAWVSQQHAQCRTIRGGSWLNAPAEIRSASRSGYLEKSLNRTIGFRVITTI
ncbi:formylglycine-generating enzyme family protein [filamentous cyanobacterium LEGE 11480]|uniref:Formylglycine-generating enzyme family protein n=1 Tax=Romeriopsis navalis LEGE 11480 TaxID=2777977 RepID=A0A928VGV7_9CYAN|nr:formylglycine-generating enzyme family protein [Romeriopsis navalis]MBE9028363.1 formylglycine-generating enzyme family protein [Romeriopsis navalis LEGE 11480]